ncbi:MAG: hypothetical protein GXY32_05915 [Ruminococcaceae bacterium]|nr:hypothetical protein [Oscillospiraceae bacterium]
MELSSLMGDSASQGKEAPTAFEYGAQISSSLISGEAKIVVSESGLKVTALFDAVEIPYSDIAGLAMKDYGVILHTTSVGDVHLSRMGSLSEPFYFAALDAYNKKVLKALFVSGKSALETKGAYICVEDGIVTSGAAPIQVYDNCVCILPPDLGARRIPLCFVTGMEKKDYSITLHLDSAEQFTFEKLGYDTEPFAAAVEKQIRTMREKTLVAVREFDPTLTAVQAAAIAKLIPQGVAAPVGRLGVIAPSFVAALEAAIADSRAADSYSVFKEMCDPTQIYIGFKQDEGRDGKGEGDLSIPPRVQDDLVLWMIIPSPDGHAGAVEFAGGENAAAATFVYRFGGDYKHFAQKLNRALEATAFKREIIRLTEEELHQPQNEDYRMAAQRTHAIQFVRGCFTGRAIHTSLDNWKKQLLALWHY